MIKEKAEYLYSEMNGISDVYISEALQLRKRKKPGAAFFASGAAAVLIIAVLLPVLWLFVRHNNQDSVSFQLSVSGAEGEIVANVSEIEFFDGKAKLIISENDGFKIVSLPGASSNTIERILSENQLSSLSVNQSGQAGQPEIPKMWLSLGDGRVISPYLKYSPGNISAGVLFDYEPEGEPPRRLTEYISDLLS